MAGKRRQKRLTPEMEVKIRLHTLAQFISGLWPSGSQEAKDAYRTITDFPPLKKRGRRTR